MRYRRWLAAVTIVLVAGCVAEPVDWGDVSYRATQLRDPDARSAIMSAGLPAVAGTTASCIRSIRVAAAAANMFRAWWSVRADSSAVLSLQHSVDAGVNWEKPVEVDARDRGRRGCERPPPGIFYDSASGYVHLVYFIEGSDGAGVFFAHSMDNGGGVFLPVPAVFGNAAALPGAA